MAAEPATATAEPSSPGCLGVAPAFQRPAFRVKINAPVSDRFTTSVLPDTASQRPSSVIAGPSLSPAPCCFHAPAVLTKTYTRPTREGLRWGSPTVTVVPEIATAWPNRAPDPPPPLPPAARLSSAVCFHFPAVWANTNARPAEICAYCAPTTAVVPAIATEPPKPLPLAPASLSSAVCFHPVEVFANTYAAPNAVPC